MQMRKSISSLTDLVFSRSLAIVALVVVATVTQAQIPQLGGAKDPIAQPDQCPPEFRGENGRCQCPSYLEKVTVPGGAPCCLKPCKNDETRNGLECVTDPAKQAANTIRLCPPGWSGTFPLCCAPGKVLKSGRCVSPSDGPPKKAKPSVTCPGGFRVWHHQCAPVYCPSARPKHCRAGFRYMNGRCIPHVPAKCPNVILDTSPNRGYPRNMRPSNEGRSPSYCQKANESSTPSAWPSETLFSNY